MALLIVYPSALEFWLFQKGLPYSVYSRAYMEKASVNYLLSESFKREESYQLLNYLNFTLPIHVAVPKGVFRNIATQIVFHRLPEALPPGSFMKVEDGLYIASPEFCFLQACKELPLHEAVELADELCAIYIRDGDEEYGQRRREIISTVESISRYLDKAGGIRGVNKAKRAITYALDRSNSPMETKLATIAMLPLASGGYGLLHPKLNYDVQLSRDGREYFGKSTCCCDMVWLKQRIVLEYDSNLSHLTREQHYQDKKKTTALSFSNYKTIRVTADQVRNFRTLESLFLKIRNALGMRTYKDRWEKYYDKRKEVVTAVMFGESDFV